MPVPVYVPTDTTSLTVDTCVMALRPNVRTLDFRSLSTILHLETRSTRELLWRFPNLDAVTHWDAMAFSAHRGLNVSWLYSSMDGQWVQINDTLAVTCVRHPVDCPRNSSGQGTSSQCTCDAGMSGAVVWKHRLGRAICCASLKPLYKLRHGSCAARGLGGHAVRSRTCVLHEANTFA